MNFAGIFLIALIFMIVLSPFLAFAAKVIEEYGNCDYYQQLKPTEQVAIFSPGYSKNYIPGTKCRWTAEAPIGYKLSMSCKDFQLPKLFGCLSDEMSISTTGRADMLDAKKFCGKQPLSIESKGTKMIIALKSNGKSVGGRFYCVIQTLKEKPSCTCGVRNRDRGRIGNYECAIFS